MAYMKELHLSKIVMFPTSPTIAKSVGEIGFLIGAGVMAVFLIAIITQKTQTKHHDLRKDRPRMITKK